MDNKFSLTVLGTRGSMPVEGKNFALYGGATSCYRVLAGNEEIYLDAGSGIVGAKALPNSRVTILLTHMHLDHIIGLPFFSTLTEKGRPIDIYAGKHSGLFNKEAIDRVFSPPFWPCKIGDYPAQVNFHDLAEVTGEMIIGDVKIKMIEGTHPQGATIYRLERGGKSIVYATDFEHYSEGCAALAEFATDCDLLLYDAQYNEIEYEACRGYGHSTPEEGLKIATKACVKNLVYVHHAPNRTDDDLKQMDAKYFLENVPVTFAKIGDEFLL